MVCFRTINIAKLLFCHTKSVWSGGYRRWKNRYCSGKTFLIILFSSITSKEKKCYTALEWFIILLRSHVYFRVKHFSLEFSNTNVNLCSICGFIMLFVLGNLEQYCLVTNYIYIYNSFRFFQSFLAFKFLSKWFGLLFPQVWDVITDRMCGPCTDAPGN